MRSENTSDASLRLEEYNAMKDRGLRQELLSLPDAAVISWNVGGKHVAVTAEFMKRMLRRQEK